LSISLSGKFGWCHADRFQKDFVSSLSLVFTAVKMWLDLLLNLCCPHHWRWRWWLAKRWIWIYISIFFSYLAFWNVCSIFLENQCGYQTKWCPDSSCYVSVSSHQDGFNSVTKRIYAPDVWGLRDFFLLMYFVFVGCRCALVISLFCCDICVTDCSTQCCELSSVLCNFWLIVVIVG
jgi:hypothetical protein